MSRTRTDDVKLRLYRDKWAIEYYEHGERRRVSTGTADERVARQALADFQAKLESHPLKLTMAGALDTYVENRDGKVMAPLRMKECASVLKAGLGDLRVDQINQTQWDHYADGRVTRPHGGARGAKNHKPRPISTSTLRREFNVLRAALRLAWKNGHLVKPPTLEPPAETAPRDRYITKAEARKLLDACETAHVRVFLALAFYTGARKSSVLSLTWDRVDFTTGTVDFQEPGRVLTKKRRSIVPISPRLLPILEQAHLMRQSNYVVEYNGKPVPTGLRWSWQKLCKRAELTWVPTPHHIKHSVASWFAMENVPLDQAADWLATDSTTLRKVYRKFDPAYLRQAVGALDF